MKDTKVVFMGTPTFAVPILENLIKETNVIGVVTQPDKKIGRKQILTPCPIKELAEKHNIKVYQPEKIKEDYAFIKELNPDVIVTCAYGQILPEELIYYPKYNTINVHASLLPLLRGGAPIHHAIKNGDTKTGITIMETSTGMDNGDILSQREIEILPTDTYDTLSSKLSSLGADFLLEVLPQILSGEIKHVKQDEAKATKGFVIKKEDEKLSFDKPAKEVINHIRALSSIPGAYAMLDDERIKIYNAVLTTTKSTKPGLIKNISKEGIEVETKDYNILLTDVLFPGKKRLPFKDLINGINKEKLLNKIFY